MVTSGYLATSILSRQQHFSGIFPTHVKHKNSKKTNKKNNADVSSYKTCPTCLHSALQRVCRVTSGRRNRWHGLKIPTKLICVGRRVIKCTDNGRPVLFWAQKGGGGGQRLTRGLKVGGELASEPTCQWSKTTPWQRLCRHEWQPVCLLPEKRRRRSPSSSRPDTADSVSRSHCLSCFFKALADTATLKHLQRIAWPVWELSSNAITQKMIFAQEGQLHFFSLLTTCAPVFFSL